MSNLDDRLQKLALSSYPSYKAKQAIYKDLMELIGDDFVVVTKYDEAINGVKKMQRTKLKEYCD